MYLRDYQRDGVAFFFRQYAQNQGGILGDDMVQPLSPPLWPCPLENMRTGNSSHWQSHSNTAEEASNQAYT